MKRYSFFLALAAMLVLSFGKANATIHTIGLTGTNFTPDSTLVNPGDTVRWTWFNGVHTTTSGTGAMDPNVGLLWDEPISSASPTFDYVFTAAGTFPYFCRPHEFFGMTGTIIVNNVNQPPVLAEIGAQSVDESVNLSFGVSATDADATTPTLSTSTLPTGATFNDNSNGTGTFDWTPTFVQSGVHNVTFYAADGIATDSEIVAITVNNVFAGAIRLSQITSLIGTDTLAVNRPARFTFELEQSTGGDLDAFTSGFRVYTNLSLSNPSQSGYFDAITFDTLTIIPSWRSLFDFGFFKTPLGVDGIGADTVGFGALSFNNSGIPTGFHQDVWWIETTPRVPGDILCVDTTFYGGGGFWLWTTSVGKVIPDWDGPHCFHISESCCVGTRGDLNGDGDDANILDLTFAVDRIFRGGPASLCPEEGDANGDSDSTNILDLTFLVDRIFRGGPPPGPC